MASTGDLENPETDAQAAASTLSRTENNAAGPRTGLSSPLDDPRATSQPVEMSNLYSPAGMQAPNQPIALASDTPVAPENMRESLQSAVGEARDPSNSRSAQSPAGIDQAPTENLSNLTRVTTVPAIGPDTDKPTSIPSQAVAAGPQLTITLLLHTGARHPYRIDERYLKKRNVIVADNNPVNMSVYTLKELIWRDWRDEWEPRPSSPSSIRLIHYGKMLDDKSHLKDGRFTIGETPHVVHMTIKPQDVVDDEDARIAKGGGRDRDGNERTPGCRCVIL